MIFSLLALFVTGIGVWLLRGAWYCATVSRDFIGVLFFGLLGVPTTFLGALGLLASFMAVS